MKKACTHSDFGISSAKCGIGSHHTLKVFIEKLSFFLVFLLLLSVVVSSGILTLATENLFVYNVDKTRDRVAVTRNSTYTYNYNGTVMHSNFNDSGSELTDGACASDGDTGNAACVGITNAGTVEITVNLNKNVTGLTDFFIHCHTNNGWGISLPYKIEYFVSVDGKAFSSVGLANNIPTNPSDLSAYSLGLTNEYGVGARYIKAVVYSYGAHIFIDEFAAYAYVDSKTLNSNLTDDQGITYVINDSSHTAYVSSYSDTVTVTVTETVEGGKITPTSATGCVDNVNYTIGKGSNNEINITVGYIPASHQNRPGTVYKKSYVLIHNTGVYTEGVGAYNSYVYIRSATGATSKSSWHYTVDDHSIYQTLPDNECGWHASTAYYNNYSVGIETSVDGFPGVYSGAAFNTWKKRYQTKTIPNLAMLTAELLVRHGLGCVDGTTIMQHWDGNKKNCPMQMRYNSASGTFTRYTGDLWVEFIALTKQYYKLLTTGGTITKEVTKQVANTCSNVNIPQYVLSETGKLYHVTGVASAAFSSKQNVTDVYLPNTVTWINDSAFGSSNNLKAITVSPTNEIYSSLNGILCNKSDNSVICRPSANSGAYVSVKSDPVTLRDGCLDAFDPSVIIALTQPTVNLTNNATVKPGIPLTVSWEKVANADNYGYKVVKYDSASTDMTDTLAAGSVVLTSVPTTSATSFVLDAASLLNNTWLKIIVYAKNTEKALSSYSVRYIKVTDSQAVEVDSLEEKAKIYVNGINKVPLVTNASYLYTDTYTSPFASVYWYAALAVKNLQFDNSYTVTGIYNYGEAKTVSIPVGSILIAVHSGESAQPGVSSVVLGDVLVLSNDINLSNASCVDGTSYLSVCKIVKSQVNQNENWNIKTGSKISVDQIGKRVRGLSEKTNCNAFLSEFSGNVKLFDSEGNELSADKPVCTGTIAKCYNQSGTVVDTATIIIVGDVDCDGTVTATDYLLVKRFFQGLINVNGVGLEAALTSGGSSISVTDYLQIRRYFQGLYDLFK